MLRSIIKIAYQRQKFLVRCYARRVRNPGVDRRMALLNNEHVQTSVEDLDQLDDADFSQVHKSHRQYEQDTQQYRERLQSWIVGNKYFKTKQLNFLTWSEKEQIRYLHNFDSEEWSVDKLVGSFPADRYTIVKILKAKWTPRDTNRIERHDEAVRENWEMFKSGRIKNIDDGFAAHLNQFVHRNFQEVQKPLFETTRLYDIQSLLTDGEFCQIITSCKKYAEPKQISDSEQDLKSTPSIPFKAPRKDTFLIGEVSDRDPKTLGEMKEEFGKPSEIKGQSMLDEISDNVRFWKVKRYESELISVDADQSPESKPDIREFIKIPKKLYKQGATYQLDDCFYDDDGEFLYRVPGMTGKVNR
ncbi:uncharacterized protein LOC131430698 [Malaya genurostris]|uniref:uncharacterized protein LOC131430698 n=1 Tax=Malaya genurostris TaxID=325434 RepID=UPI0026F38FA4|nr:uncharacterized protein LOC131430698 [Malaya genurostris]